MRERHIDTSHCRLAICETDGPGATLLMIHGNSSCKEVFRNQLQGRIGEENHCVAMDLPGHGRSHDAKDPDVTYSMPGYADAALELMQALGHEKYAVLGWSLGGHIGLEMIDRSDAVSGLMISGTPPVGKGEAALAEGFLVSEHMHLAGQRDFTQAEIDAYARATCGINAPYEDFLREAVARTDGRAREMMFSRFAQGVGCDQQEAAIRSKVPLAIVNGGGEPFVNNEFVSSLAYENLWEDTVHIMDGIGHAPFWEHPEAFDRHLLRLLRHIEAEAG